MASPASESAGSSSAVEARIKELHKKLHITAAQKPQWDNLAQVMRDNAQAMIDLQKQRAADAQSMSAVDVIKSYESVIEAHEDGMKKFVPPFEALYNTMSDAQKKTADSLFRSREKVSAAKQTASQVKRESIPRGSVIMQVSLKPKIELRSKIARIAAAVGLALVIGSFGVGSARADEHHGGDNRGGDQHRDNGNRGGYRGGAAASSTRQQSWTTTTRLSRTTTRRPSRTTTMGLVRDTTLRRRRASVSSSDFDSAKPFSR